MQTFQNVSGPLLLIWCASLRIWLLCNHTKKGCDKRTLNKGVCKHRQSNHHGIHFGYLESRATDIGSGHALTEGLHSRGYTSAVYTLGVYAQGAYNLGSRIWSRRFCIWKNTYASFRNVVGGPLNGKRCLGHDTPYQQSSHTVDLNLPIVGWCWTCHCWATSHPGLWKDPIDHT